MRRPILLAVVMVASQLAAASSFASARTIAPRLHHVALPGSPFAVTSTPDGRYMFASLSGAADGIAVLRQRHSSARLIRTVATEGASLGLAVTPDGRYLLDTVEPLGAATAPQGVQVIEIRKLIDDGPERYSEPSPPGPAATPPRSHSPATDALRSSPTKAARRRA